MYIYTTSTYLVVRYVHDYVCLTSIQLPATAFVDTMSHEGARPPNGGTSENIRTMCRTNVSPLRLFLGKPYRMSLVYAFV